MQSDAVAQGPASGPFPSVQSITPATAGRARALTRQLLAGLPEYVIDDSELLVSEVATNAIQHGGGMTGFGIATSAGVVAVSVRDRSNALPCETSHNEPGHPGGYGWPLVRQLAADVTITLAGDAGKTIHARLTY